MYKEQTLTINDKIKINYTQITSSGLPIVLLHGAASEWQSFLPHIPHLSEKYDVYALDLRGHGKSSWITNEYRLRDYSDDLLKFLQKKVKKPVVLYGHSLGALIALLLASQFPGKVLGLVLSDPPLYCHSLTLNQTIWREPFEKLHHVLSSYHSAEEIETYMLQQYPSMDLQKCRSRAKCLSNVDPTIVSMMMDHSYMGGFDIDNVLRKVTCSVLLIQGNPDLGAVLRDEDVVFASERLQQCSVIHMQDVGHSLLPDNLFYKMTCFLDHTLVD
jgi:pimeloyl-ACP methyl ester carboxylesterase